MIKQYDVVVIGAGPAGSTAAYYLAKKNLNVLLVDRSDFPRHKACAGALFNSEHWQFENFLHIKNQLAQQPVNTACFYHHRDYLFSFQQPNLFSQVQRYQFDHLLQQQAVEKGVVFRKFAVTRIERQTNANYSYIVYSDQETIKTQTVIGADGVSGITSRFLGNKRSQFVRCIEYDIRCNKKDNTSHFFFLWGNDLGYAWIFPTLDGYYVGLGFLGPTTLKIRDHLNNFLTHSIETGLVPSVYAIRNVFGGLDPLSVPSNYTAPNLVLCGDAMGLVNRMSGDGIFYAMQSGMLAAAAHGDNMAKDYRRLVRPLIKSVTLFPVLPPKSLGLSISKWFLYGMHHIPLVRQLILTRFFVHS